MPSPKQPRTEDSDRRIQQFLERAAPIVLEDPALTTERWQQLSAIATEFELTTEQFRTTLDDLVARGVLRRVEATMPKPPPLPRARPASESRPTPPTRPTPSATPPDRNIVSAPARATSLSDVPRNGSEPKRGEPAMPVSTANPTPESASKESQRAATGSNTSDSTEVSTGPTDKVDARWRVEGAPVPVPPRPAKKAHEIYLEFVRQSLAYIENNEISPAVEIRLISHGTRVLSLSAIYARHLLEQCATDKGFRFASPQSSTPVSDSAKEMAHDAPWDNPNDAMQAVAANHPDELSESIRQPATSTIVKPAALNVRESAAELHSKQAAARSNYIQLERVVPLREYLHSALDRVPRGLLPLPLLDKLMDTGLDLFGVDADLVLETIRHVAGELKIAVVTQQQAEEHVSEFVTDLLDTEVELTADQLEQVRQSGAHWGLNQAQIDAVVQQVCSARKALRRREEITTRLALGAAAIAVLLVVIFIGYAFLNAQS